MRVALEHAYKARHGTGATLSGAEALRILSHAADALCGEPIEPELPPAIAAALVGEAWRRGGLRGGGEGGWGGGG